jgi:hypothetical protein
MDANLKRKLARVVAILAVALGAGQLMQSLSHPDQAAQVARSETAQKAKDIEPLAAGNEATAAAALPAPALTPPRLPDNGVVRATLTGPVPALPPAAVVDLTSPALPAAPQPEAAAPAVAAADPCATTLDLANGANAMIGLTLIAPCHPNERVVLKHAGLAVTGKTTATGALFVDIPAMQKDGQVEVLFADGSKISNAVAVPEVAEMRRFAVQWQADDTFVVHAFEDELGYDGPGDVSPANPHAPAPGLPAKGGFLTLLGDATTDLPLLAQLYTLPADPKAKAVVVVEAPVTQASCGREILAETLFSSGSRVTINDLAAAMPGCDAIGDYLVLKNLVPDLNIASN